MAVIDMDMMSRSLTTRTDLYVVVPTPTLQDMIAGQDGYDPEKRWPVVYMLHGAGGNGFEWIKKADIESLCCRWGFIAVLPSTELGFYNDTPDGRAYCTYVSKELPSMIEATFHASDKMEDRYIMGYSMGGFGAVKIGLMYPDRYNKIASLSGCMDVKGFIEAFERGSIFNIHSSLPDWPDIEGGDNDTLALLQRMAERRDKGLRVPPMYHTIGRQDFIYGFSQEWRKRAQELGLELIYTEGEGVHDFSYWNPRIENEIMPFFFER